jgi:hypothetical protein
MSDPNDLNEFGGDMRQPEQARIGGFVVALVLAIGAILAGIAIAFGKAIGAL